MNFMDLRTDLQGYAARRIFFVGLGNPMRGDDSAGLELLDLVRLSGFFPGAGFLPACTNPENFLEQIVAAEPDLVIFMDACDFGERTGEIRWLDNDEIETAGISTHAYSITLLEKYLNLERKTECRYLAIQPGSTGIGECLSPEMLLRINEFFE
jgi:hydrogenase 3 maturation protease